MTYCVFFSHKIKTIFKQVFINVKKKISRIPSSSIIIIVFIITSWSFNVLYIIRILLFFYYFIHIFWCIRKENRHKWKNKFLQPLFDIKIKIPIVWMYEGIFITEIKQEWKPSRSHQTINISKERNFFLCFLIKIKKENMKPNKKWKTTKKKEKKNKGFIFLCQVNRES